MSKAFSNCDTVGRISQFVVDGNDSPRMPDSSPRILPLILRLMWDHSASGKFNMKESSSRSWLGQDSETRKCDRQLSLLHLMTKYVSKTAAGSAKRFENVSQPLWITIRDESDQSGEFVTGKIGR